GLYYPRRPVGWGRGPHHWLETARAGDYRFDPAHLRRRGRAQYPRPDDLRPDRRGDLAHRQRRVGLQPVRLNRFREGRKRSVAAVSGLRACRPSAIATLVRADTLGGSADG